MVEPQSKTYRSYQELGNVRSRAYPFGCRRCLGTSPSSSLRERSRGVAVAASGWPELHLYLYIHARWQIEAHQSINGLRGGVKDINQSLVDPHLVLLARILVDERRAERRLAAALRGERNRSGDSRTRTLRSLDDGLI